MMNKILNALLVVLACATFSFGQDANASSEAASGGISVPLFVGGSVGIGSGTGVGSERGVGIRNVEALAGYWYPHLGFGRIGYGFSAFEEEAEDDEKYSVEHSDFDVELGVHAYGDLYLVGSYSRARDLSDLGDVAWNEWGVGVGSVVSIFSKTMLIAEIQYRWVLDHYDPFLDKNVNGTRLQFNFGFVVYVY